jgi:mannose-1-phosphate guanylyltransferase/mannose-6-phosphate isomerase
MHVNSHHHPALVNDELGLDLLRADEALANDVVPVATRIVPVILSGGSGTRLWPVSRESFPKQLWPLISERTMLQETALRACTDPAGRVDFAPPVVVCNQEHRFLVAAQLAAAGITDRRIILEPVGRDSAAAAAAAALLVSEEDPDALIWIMAADAMIGDTEALHRLLPVAAAAARLGSIVTFGIQPTAPETGYGYIEVGAALDAVPGAHIVARFEEKPPADVAAGFVASGRHLWNSGMFVFTARSLLRELREHAPEVAERVSDAVRQCRQDLDFVRLDFAAFSAAPSLSLDYAVAERTSHAAVVPADMGWGDIGSWDAIWKFGQKDGQGNVAVGDTLLVKSEDCYVRSDGILTAVVGLKDAVVVVTPDAVLAMHRDQAQQVKEVVRRLQGTQRKEALSHNRCYRPWGFYETLILQSRFQVKRIVVEPGKMLSLQKHFHRAEHWVVVEGSALVVRDSEEVLLRENESIYLPLGCVHRLVNPGRIPLALIEVQVGSYLGEDDIVRLEDAYARC